MSAALPTDLYDKEGKKFEETLEGEVAVRVIVAEIPAGAITVGLTPANNIKISNINIALADTEYSHSLTAGTKRIIIRARGLVNTKYAFTVNESGTNYISIPVGCEDEIADLLFTGKTLYVQCSAATVLEVKEFY